MEHRDGFFKGVRDTDIYYQKWLPDSPARAVLLVVHGLAEHSGRYLNLVNYFVPRGYAVYALDHIGHGKSGGARVFVKRFHDFINPLKRYFDMLEAEQPQVPIFLVGHSMGGLIAAAYLLQHPQGLSGAVLSGPSIKVPDNVSSVTVWAGRLFSFLMPRLGVIQLDAQGISRDPEVVKAYKNDPLVYTGKVTARLGAEMLKTMGRVTTEAAAIELPLFIVQGTDDKLVDPAGARLLYDSIGSSDKTVKHYQGFYHEIFNEPEHQHVLKDVETWFQAHFNAPV